MEKNNKIFLRLLKRINWRLIILFTGILFWAVVALCLFNYDLYRTYQITGKWFRLEKPVEKYRLPFERWSFHGDDCHIDIYNIPKRLQNYFQKPPSDFSEHPLSKNYVKKWDNKILSNDKYFVLNTLEQWKVTPEIIEKVDTSLNLETTYYSYTTACRGPRPNEKNYYPTSFNFYILDQLNSQFIRIIVR